MRLSRYSIHHCSYPSPGRPRPLNGDDKTKSINLSLKEELIWTIGLSVSPLIFRFVSILIQDASKFANETQFQLEPTRDPLAPLPRFSNLESRMAGEWNYIVAAFHFYENSMFFVY